MGDLKHTPVTLTEQHEQPARTVFSSLSIESAYAKVRPAYINNLPIIKQRNYNAPGFYPQNATADINRLRDLGFKSHIITQRRASGLGDNWHWRLTGLYSKI